MADDIRRVLGVVLSDDVEFVAPTNNYLAETGRDVEVNADEKPVVVCDLGIAPVKISVEGVIDGCVGEVREISKNVTRDKLRIVVLIETFDKSGWEIGVVGGFALINRLSSLSAPSMKVLYIHLYPSGVDATAN